MLIVEYRIVKLLLVSVFFLRMVITRALIAHYCLLRGHWFGVKPRNKGHKVKDGALKTALSPIAICGRVLLPTGVGATMPAAAAVAATKVTLQRSITTIRARLHQHRFHLNVI